LPPPVMMTVRPIRSKRWFMLVPRENSADATRHLWPRPSPSHGADAKATGTHCAATPALTYNTFVAPGT
jgi:hypothetical protein